MLKRYPWMLPALFVLSSIGIIAGVVLRAKNAARVQECATTLGRAGTLLSRHVREACATAKTLSLTGTALAIGCGILAGIVAVVGIVHLMSGSQSRSSVDR